MISANARSRRAVTIAVTVIGSLLTIRFVILPYAVSVRGLRESAVEQEQLLAAERTSVEEADRLPQQVEDALFRDDVSKRAFLPALTPAMPHAVLAARIDSVAEDNYSVELSRIEPLAARDAGYGVRAVPLRIAGEGDLEGLLDLLLGLEQSRITVSIADLTLDVRGNSGQTPQTSEAPEVIGFSFTVIGYSIAGRKGAT